MAITYPRVLLDEDVKSPAERRMFALLHEQLSDEWELFHSVSFLVRDPARGAQDDEADFVLCHADLGIVCLEVKGGGIECRYGAWSRIDRAGNREPMVDPFGQALDHRYNLQRKIDTVAGRRAADLFLVHALAFPDINVHGLVLAPDAPAEILMGRSDLPDLSAAIDRALAYHRGARDRRQPLGAAGMTMMRDLLAPRISIPVPMASDFMDEEEQLILLTHEQSAFLRRLARDRRLVVRGCAGSGKTMLAVEQAKRWVRDGRNVLFVCFNRALLEHLRDREARSGVEFSTFHALCTTWAAQAGIALTDHPPGAAPQSFFYDELPLALLDASEQLGGRYDAIVVDEAQDLYSDWLTTLTGTLRDEQDGAIWLFMDDNQEVFDGRLEVPDEYRPFELTVNCRNTRRIHEQVMKLYRGTVEPDLQGPLGREIEVMSGLRPHEDLVQVLERLCGQEEVPPQDVVVLSSHALANSALGQQGGGRYQFVEHRGQLGDRIHFSSIRGFKGLEAPVVVLCELEDLDPGKRDSQLYVALSRARNHCVIIGAGLQRD